MKDIQVSKQQFNDALSKIIVDFPSYYFISVNLSLMSVGIYLQTLRISSFFVFLPSIVTQTLWTMAQRRHRRGFHTPFISRLAYILPSDMAKVILGLYLVGWIWYAGIVANILRTQDQGGIGNFRNFLAADASAFLMAFLIPLFVLDHRIKGLLAWSIGYLVMLFMAMHWILPSLLMERLGLVMVGFMTGLILGAGLLIFVMLLILNDEQKRKIEESSLLMNTIMTYTPTPMALIGSHLQLAGLTSQAFRELFGEERDFAVVLARKMEITEDSIAIIRSVVDAVLHESSLAFELNVASLPRRLLSYQGRSFDVSWQAVPGLGDFTQFLIVSLSDLTESLNLLAREDETVREMKTLAALAVCGEDRYRQFHNRVTLVETEILAELNEEHLHGWPKGRWLGMLHTIKGNARSLNLPELAQEAHVLEQLVLAATEPNQGDRSALSDGLHKICSLADARLKLAEKHLQWESAQAVARIRKSTLMLAARSSQVSDGLATVLAEAFPSLQDYLCTLMNEADSLAKRLHKAVPVIIVQGHSPLILPSGSAALDAAIPHIIGNAMDHGIESPEVRVKAGKPASGCLTVTAAIQNEELHLVFEDDGCGLDLRKLRAKAIYAFGAEKGIALSLGELSELIFHAGISTKESVSEISGRGVGMGAAREAISAIGGRMFTMLLGGPNHESNSGVPFVIQVTLPMEHFIRVAS